MRAGHRPSHVLYGGAQRFHAGAPEKLSKMAADCFREHGVESDPGAFARVVGASDAIAMELVTRVRAKLEARAVERMCIDFEDGYGVRSGDEEDAHADAAGAALATIPRGSPALPSIGMRIKGIGGATHDRALRTLERFVAALCASGQGVPAGFTVTLPKVSGAAEVIELVDALASLEEKHALATGAIGVELMVETPQALYDASGRLALPAAIAAAGGRCTAVHLGAYDLTASLGVVGPAQTLDHLACDHARTLMTLATAGSGVAVVDGATNTLPLGKRDDVERGWRLHAANVARALRAGIYEGWDLHPAQLPARYGALFAFYLQAAKEVGERLAAFLENAARATRVGAAFDDAATGRGLVAFFERGLACGALGDADLVAAGISREVLASHPFAEAMR
ncbi:MAG: phosphoenolpyruvate kinase [Deltaproteobacteria bacterium]|nr:phosphoenolpyruvate kinase [Deltaproteobacteria bacterium]